MGYFVEFDQLNRKIVVNEMSEALERNFQNLILGQLNPYVIVSLAENRKDALAVATLVKKEIVKREKAYERVLHEP